MDTNKTMRVRIQSFVQVIILVGLSAFSSGASANEEASAQTETPVSSSIASEVSGKTIERNARKQRQVIVNQTRISEETLQNLESKYRVRSNDGRYWYDKASGAWGLEGGPCLGFGIPGLDIGGPLRADASKGQTGIFVNGRELHLQDVIAIQMALGIPPQRGRYSWDAQGNVAYEGGPILFNVRELVIARGRNQGRSWSHHSSTGATVGGDGQGFLYYQDANTSYSSGN